MPVAKGRETESSDRLTASYLPIRDYAIIGDARSAALLSRDGSVDWLCWPRFDSRSVFARILDAEKGGFFSIRPQGRFQVSRRYIDSTNVLETTFTTDGGRAVLLDLMPALSEEQKATRLLPFRSLLRRIECLSGSIDIDVVYSPRPDYARSEPRLEYRRSDTIWCADGPEVWHLRSDASLALTDHGSATAQFRLAAGERKYFSLSYETHAPAVFGNLGALADREIEETIAFWKAWAAGFRYDGPYADAVLRSALALKLLTYAPSGGIVAAPTTSLPEHSGGVRNWDYRFCWLRDASFTVGALYDCGFATEGAAFTEWLLYATRLTHPGLQILYDVFGESRLPESTLEHLDGYCGSRPVRIGNAAHGQFQLDVYGEVLGAVEEYVDRGERLFGDTRRLIRNLAEMVVKRWREPDSGIWEKRSGLRQHVHAKVMAWSALDCAERLAGKAGLEADVSKWRREKDEIKRVVIERGFSQKLNSFVSVLDGDELDASLLYVSRVGFLEADDPRILGTIEAIRKRLGNDDLVHRYSEDTDDGLPAGEGAFLPCSFWLVEALALAGRLDEAHPIFEKLLERANDVGLLSEECDVDSGALLGNFPQALTHIGLMSAALRLDKPVPKKGVRGEASGKKPPHAGGESPGR